MLSTEPLHRALGLTDDELQAIVALLGRDPSELELAMYAVMWSEHCSYKSSKVHLRRFESDAPWVLVGPGEGAGVIDVGDGLAVAVHAVTSSRAGSAAGSSMMQRGQNGTWPQYSTVPTRT